jgi:hypothetical protein
VWAQQARSASLAPARRAAAETAQGLRQAQPEREWAQPERVAEQAGIEGVESQADAQARADEETSVRPEPVEGLDE